MKNSYLFLGIILFIGLVGGFLYYDHSRSTYIAPGQDSGSDSGDFQKVVLSFKNYNYFPNTVEVEVGKPVRIYLDSSVGGCYRSFTIKQLGVSKYLRTPEDYVEFTPKEAGTYRFACSMGMGYGNLIVK